MSDAQKYVKVIEWSEEDQRSVAMAIRSSICLKAAERLYVILDACQASDLVDVARSQFKQPVRMLFKGAAASCEEIESVAPYFIPVDLETEFLEHWSEFWGRNAGILFVSAAEPRVIFRHLRKIFVVQDEQGQEYFFRFYDPRVLRVYLPTCTPEELTEFFGPVERFVLEGDDPNSLLSLAFELGELKTSSRLLAGEGAVANNSR